MAVGLVLRVGAALGLDAEMIPRGDEGPYLLQSGRLFTEGELDTGFFVRPPIYFGFLAAVSWPAQWLGITPRNPTNQTCLGLRATLTQGTGIAHSAII